MRTPISNTMIKKSGEPNEHADICQRFAQTRTDMNITQNDFAEMLGIKLSTVKAIERGYHSPSLSVIKVWSKRFNKSLNWIFWGKE